MTELNLPAHIASRQSRGLAAQLALSLPTGTVPYLSIKGSRFTLFDAAGNERQVGAMSPDLGMYLDLCIVDSNPKVSKIYYAREFDPNAEMVPPDCWSDNGLAPSSQAISPQHGDCKTCPHNQWGSATSRLTGKGTKACNDVQKVAIAVPGTGDMIFLLRIPPASLKNLAKYIQEIGSFSAGGRKVDINDLITRVYFDKEAVGILKFTAAGWVDEATAAVSDKAYESKSTAQIVGKNDQPYTGAIEVLPAAQTAEERALSTRVMAPPPPSPMQVNSQPGQIAFPQTVDTPPAPKPRGRPRKEPAQEVPATQAPFMSAPVAVPSSSGAQVQPALGALQGNGEDEGIPSFLKRTETPPAPTAKPAGPSFGMQAPTPIPEDMNARIAAALAIKT